MALDPPDLLESDGLPLTSSPGRMFAAVNAMMLDVLAAVARKDYDDRRRRQAEGDCQGEGVWPLQRAGGKTRLATTG